MLTFGGHLEVLRRMSFRIIAVMGLVFQLPVIAFFLGKLDLISSNMLKHYRKYALIIIMLVAAIITPP